MLKGAIYCRVSSSNQEEEGTSLETQEELNREYAKENGLYVPEEYIFIEQYSGGFFDRPKLSRLLELAETGEIDFVIFTETDRIAREPEAYYPIKSILQKNNVTIHYSVESQTGDEASDNFMGGMKINFASRERNMIRSRTTRGKKALAKDNKRIFPLVPFGYNKNPKTKELEINKVEADFILRIVKLYIEDYYTYEKIAKLMMLEKILPPSLWRKTEEELVEIGLDEDRKNSIYFWSNNAVRRLLSKANLYAGTYQAFTKQYKKVGDKSIILGERPKDEWISIKIPPIINEQQAQEIFEQMNKNQRLSKKRRKRNYLLQGKLFCDCEEPTLHSFVGYFHNPKQKTNYRCGLYNTTKVSKDRRCKNHISGMKIEKLIMDTLYEMFSDPYYIVDLANHTRSELNNEGEEETGGENRVKKLFKEIEDIKIKLSRSEELCIEGLISKARFIEIKEGLEKNREKFSKEIEKEEEREKSKELSERAKICIESLFFKYCNEIEDFFLTATYEEMRELVDIAIEKVIIPVNKNKPVEIVMKIPGHFLTFEARYSDNFKEINSIKDYENYVAKPTELDVAPSLSPIKKRIVRLNNNNLDDLDYHERKGRFRFLELLKGGSNKYDLSHHKNNLMIKLKGKRLDPFTFLFCLI